MYRVISQQQISQGSTSEYVALELSTLILSLTISLIQIVKYSISLRVSLSP